MTQRTDLILLLTPQKTAIGVLCPSDVINLAGEAGVLNTGVLQCAGDTLTTLRALEVSCGQEAGVSNIIANE